MKTIRCKCCGKIVPANPRLKNQRYCSKTECQRERKRLWQKDKLKTDPDYRANQKDCRQRWIEIRENATKKRSLCPFGV